MDVREALYTTRAMRRVTSEPIPMDVQERIMDAAVRATEDALLESGDGDVLVFLPTERDIREVREMMEEMLGRGTEVLALYGRMPAAEQARIFSPGPRRRVVLATGHRSTATTRSPRPCRHAHRAGRTSAPFVAVHHAGNAHRGRSSAA